MGSALKGIGGVAQAVSKQVAQLEELLQHLLFRRVRRRLQMTPAGDLYLVEVRKILTQVEMSTHYLRSYGGETEVLRVSTPPTFGARWLVPRRATTSAGTRPIRAMKSAAVAKAAAPNRATQSASTQGANQRLW